MRIHRERPERKQKSIVVNCFQYTNFSEDSQVSLAREIYGMVVNCFQYTNFSEDSQVAKACTISASSCELLSVY